MVSSIRRSSSSLFEVANRLDEVQAICQEFQTDGSQRVGVVGFASEWIPAVSGNSESSF